MRVRECKFKIGEVYLFNIRDPRCAAHDSLWATYDKHCAGAIHLEAVTRDSRRFVLRKTLPAAYRYCRVATRSELRDYMTGMALAMNTMHTMHSHAWRP